MLELGEVRVASRHLIVHLQGLPGNPWSRDQAVYGSGVHTPCFEIACAPPVISPTKEAEAIHCPEYSQHGQSNSIEGQEAADLFGAMNGW